MLAQTDPAVRAAADAAGKGVGYYNSDDCEDVFALSVLAETAAVRARLLLGIANWKLQVGSFLLWYVQHPLRLLSKPQSSGCPGA